MVTSAVPFASKGKLESITDASLEADKSKTSKTKSKHEAADTIEAGGKLITGADGSTSVILGGAGIARMGANTEIQIPDAKTKEHSLEMLKGKLFLNISAEDLKKRKAGEFKLKTPAALLAVKGTKFFATSKDGTDTIGVSEGSVSVTEPASKTTVTVTTGQAISVNKNGFTATRPFNDQELALTTQTEAAALVRTPLGIAYPRFSPTKMYLDGKLYSGADVEDDRRLIEREHLKTGNIFLNGNYEVKTSLTIDGMLLSTVIYDPSHASGRSAGTAKNTGMDQGLGAYISMELPIHLKGKAWRAKNAGLVNIGNAVVLQFRLRCKNVSEVRSLNIEAHNSVSSGQYATIHAPASLEADGYWSSVCIVPVTLHKSGEDSSHSLTIYAALNRTSDEPQSTKKTAKVDKQTAEIEIGDFSFLSTPK